GGGRLAATGAIGGDTGRRVSFGEAHAGGQEAAPVDAVARRPHHGMYLVGLPYSERALSETAGGGTPYGASHVSGAGTAVTLTEHEKALAQALGKRVAALAVRLGSSASGPRPAA